MKREDLYDDFIFESKGTALEDYADDNDDYAENVDNDDDDIDDEEYDSREDAYQDYVFTTDNEALKVMTNNVELYLKHNCANHEYFTEQELQQIAVELKSPNAVISAKAKEKISMAVFKYVRHIASQRYKMYYQHIPDLVQEGFCAVLAHADKYDPSKGTLTTFFKPHILAQMRTWVSENKYNLKNANHYGNNIRQIERKINEKQKKGETIIVDDLYISGGMAQTTVERCLAIKDKSEQSISMDDEDAYIGSTAESLYPGPEKVVIEKEKNEALAKFINNLDERSKDVLLRRHGIIDGREQPISEIARSLGISPQNVRDIIRKALLQLRDEMEKSAIFNNDRRERRKIYNVNAVDFHKKSKDLQKLLDEIDLEDECFAPDFVS